ncbi:MAG: histidine kinase [Solirubrobacteraceae bacterium]|nr:histidine kinase [Solirubrobacteraceae bacterium]
MRRRLILSTALIALAAVIVLGVPLGAVEAARLREDTTARLEREADAAAGAVDDLLERHHTISPALLRRYVKPSHRIVLSPSDGPIVTSGPPLHGEMLRVHAGTGARGSVVAEAPMRELDERVHNEWLLIAALGLGGVLMAVALSALQARRLARPLEAVARGSARLGDGDFSVRVGHFGVPEIDAIAQGLDTSAARIAELVAREREFSANVSHQLRTPLTALRLRLEGAGEEVDDADRQRELDAALVEADRLEATIGDLLAHARQRSEGQPITVNLGSLAHEHGATWRPVFARDGRALEVTAAKNVLVEASRGTVGQVLDVLLDNALRHGAGTTRIEVAVDGRAARLAVSDAGSGIPEADRDAIFERGASRTGSTGIGLHLARTLAQADRGSLRLAPGGQTRFELRLPLLRP